MKERVIALGFFDGVHLGHAALLRRTVAEAQKRGVTPAVFTFDRPPKEVVTGVPCPLIASPEDRRGLLERQFGIRDIIMVPFDDEMRTTAWDDFITRILVGRYHAGWRATTTISATKTQAPRRFWPQNAPNWALAATLSPKWSWTASPSVPPTSAPLWVWARWSGPPGIWATPTC